MPSLEIHQPDSEAGRKLYEQMEHAASSRGSWTYETNPHHVFDGTMSRLLRPIMLAKSDGKISHWWHWNELPEDMDLVNEGGIELLGNKDSFAVESGHDISRRVKRVRMSLGGWQEAYIIGPDMEKTSSDDYENGWRFAFQRKGENDTTRQFNSIILHGPTRILAGPDNFVVGALKPYSMEALPLAAAGSFPNRASLPLI